FSMIKDVRSSVSKMMININYQNFFVIFLIENYLFNLYGAI
ncbi:unnamed protein product, partial [marine sediment metagenome]